MGISTEMLMCEDMASCTDLTHRHVVDQITTLCHCSAYQQLLYSCSKYFLCKHCFLKSNKQYNTRARHAKSHDDLLRLQRFVEICDLYVL